MFDKYKNIKKIGLALIGLLIVVFIIANVRIRSVDSYRSQYNNMADAGQTTKPDNTENSMKQTASSETGTDETQSNSAEVPDNNDENVVTSPENTTSSANVADSNNPYAGSSEGSSDDNYRSDGVYADGGNSGAGNDKGNQSDNSDREDGSQNTKPSGPVITCTIEIRCDNATARKDTIANPGIRDAIPDDGTILEVTTYSDNEGFSVYDVLAAVTAMNKIPMAANSNKTYVSSINNLSEKNVGPTSGWTYRVNGELPMMAACNYKVKNGDVIKWIYVCQWGDS